METVICSFRVFGVCWRRSSIPGLTRSKSGGRAARGGATRVRVRGGGGDRAEARGGDAGGLQLKGVRGRSGESMQLALLEVASVTGPRLVLGAKALGDTNLYYLKFNLIFV